MTFWKTVLAVVVGILILLAAAAVLSGLGPGASADLEDFERRVVAETRSAGDVEFRALHQAGDELCGELNQREPVGDSYSYTGFRRFVADRDREQGTTSLQVEVYSEIRTEAQLAQALKRDAEMCRRQPELIYTEAGQRVCGPSANERNGYDQFVRFEKLFAACMAKAQ